jgi:hypothetical protein
MSEQRPIIDWHSHVWLPEHLGDEWGPQLDAKYAHDPSLGGSYEQHEEASARAGVTHSVVIALWSDYLNLHVPNEYIAGYVERRKGNVVGVASVDPNRMTAVDELIYANETLGLNGVKLAPPYQNFHPHSPEAFAVYRAAAERGMFLWWHQGGVTHRRGVLEVAQPVLLDKVAREFPDTTIVIAHMGQPWQNEVIPLLRKHENVYTDVSARCSRPAQLAQMLRMAKDYNALDRIVWGSDFPTFDITAHANGLLSVADDPTSGITREEVEDILYGRPLHHLGFDW